LNRILLFTARSPSTTLRVTRGTESAEKEYFLKGQISMNKVENLKKITLSFQAGTSKDTMDLTPKYAEFDFIFAIGPDGMTPFEYELVDKAEGEEVKYGG